MAIHFCIFKLLLILGVRIIAGTSHNNCTNSSSFCALNAGDDINDSIVSNSNDPTEQLNSIDNVRLLEWAEPEEHFYGMIKQFKFQDENVNSACRQAIFSYIKDYEEAMTEDPLKSIMTNPLVIFKMIWRLAKKYPEIRASCQSVVSNEEMSRIIKHFDVSSKTLDILLPSKSDLRNAVIGIFLLTLVYKLDTRSLSRGIIGNLETGVKLNYENCLDISRITASLPKEMLEIHYAIEWLETARDLAFQDFGYTEIISDFDAEIHNLHLQHDKMFDSYESGIPLSFVNLYFDAWDLCTGKSTQTNSQKSKLKCYQSRNAHPYFLINPLQIEVLNEDPFLIQIYNFIGDTTIKNILDEVKTNLYPMEASEPVSIPDKDYMQTWYKTLAFTTGLNIFGKGCEDLRVLRYSSLASNFHLHTDDDEVEVNGDTNRLLMTAIYYINDVEMGGSTTFPKLGVAARPVKNSAIVWYNQHPNATMSDERTIHTGCPIAFGRKDIATKTILDLPNIFTRKCPLDRYATHNLQFLKENGLLN